MNDERLNQEIESLYEELEDIKENMIYLLTHQDIKDINLLNFHFEVQRLINRIDYLDKLLFDLKY